MCKEFSQFLELFEKNPNIAILNINDGCDTIKSNLQYLVDELGGKLVNKEFKELDSLKIRLTPREFEYAVICDCLDKFEDEDKIIKEVYHSLENSAQIILLSKKGKIDPYKIIDILDKNDFRAMNKIDIFEKYDLVTAKKMHMWGNGL